MNNQVTKKNFFISYNSNDKEWAEWIAWQLEGEGYTTIIQAWDFRPGGNFILEMDLATKAADRTIAVLSQNYIDAFYTHPEWAAALRQDPTGDKRLLLPILVHKCNLSGLLAQIIYINLVDLSEQDARDALLEGVRQGRNKIRSSPKFPGNQS